MYDQRIGASFLAGEDFIFTTGSRSTVGSPKLLLNAQSWEKLAGYESDHSSRKVPKHSSYCT